MKLYIESNDCGGKDVVAQHILNTHSCEDVVVGRLNLCGHNRWSIDVSKEISTNDPLFTPCWIRSITEDLTHAYIHGLSENRIQISFSAARSAAFCKARGENEIAAIYETLLGGLPPFETIVVLAASIATKQQRLGKRKSMLGPCTDHDELLFRDPDFVSKMDIAIEDVMKKKLGASIVDTDTLSVAEVAQLVVNLPKTKVYNNFGRPINWDMLAYVQKQISCMVEKGKDDTKLSPDRIQELLQPICLR